MGVWSLAAATAEIKDHQSRLGQLEHEHGAAQEATELATTEWGDADTELRTLQGRKSKQSRNDQC